MGWRWRHTALLGAEEAPGDVCAVTDGRVSVVGVGAVARDLAVAGGGVMSSEEGICVDGAMRWLCAYLWSVRSTGGLRCGSRK
jgi:hypothetical protein